MFIIYFFHFCFTYFLAFVVSSVQRWMGSLAFQQIHGNTKQEVLHLEKLVELCKKIYQSIKIKH